jgi:hypothetical protein
MREGGFVFGGMKNNMTVLYIVDLVRRGDKREGN